MGTRQITSPSRQTSQRQGRSFNIGQMGWNHQQAIHRDDDVLSKSAGQGQLSEYAVDGNRALEHNR